MAHYKSIFISDVHLGTRGCRADDLLDFLKNNTCDKLFLVGDIIDGWRLRKRWYFPQSHLNVVRKILSYARQGVEVYYVVGNHDEILRKFLNFDISIGRIKVVNYVTYNAVNEKKYFVVHGDMFDNLMMPNRKWVMHLGDVLYNFLIWANTHLNSARKVLKMEYWSLSKYLKRQAKSATGFIQSFEKHVAEYCKKKGYDGIICGHIHHPEQKTITGVEYKNSGDWVESCSALVETITGEWKIEYWSKRVKEKS